MPAKKAAKVEPYPKRDNNDAYTRFQQLTHQLVQVPKEEIDKQRGKKPPS
jgi:hypothetical protein